MHHNKSELDKVSANFKDYTVYIHDKSSTYKIEKASLSPGGIKGNPVAITDQAQIAEIKNPNTARLIRKHKHDLSLYTKTEISSNPTGVILKKDDITDVAYANHPKSKFDTGLYLQILAVAALGTLIWVGVVTSFGGLL